jgi:large subunit ribosomal protein L10
MPRPEKVAVVDEIAEKMERTQSLFLTDFTGLDVEAINELRRLLRENDVEYRVVKNTLARLAADKAGREDLKPYLIGPTAMAFGYQDPLLPARLIGQFAQKTGKPAVKVILFEGQILEKEALDRLKNLPSRDQLLAQLLGGLNAPVTGLVMVIKGLLREVVGLVDAIAKAKEEKGEGGEPETEAAAAKEAEKSPDKEAAPAEEKANDTGKKEAAPTGKKAKDAGGKEKAKAEEKTGTADEEKEAAPAEAEAKADDAASTTEKKEETVPEAAQDAPEAGPDDTPDDADKQDDKS